MFWVRISYTTDEPVRLWARPYLNGKEVVLPGTRSNPSITHTGSGDALGWFAFGQAAQADELRIQAGTRTSPQSLEIARYPITLIATGLPGAARTPAPWVDGLRRETETRARLERQSAASRPASTTDSILTSALMVLVAAVVFGVPALLVWTAWKARKEGSATAPGEYAAYAVSAFTGLAVCLAIAVGTGRKEAWDSGLYYSVGLPVMVLAIFVISYFFPRRAWRWTLAMALGQAGALLWGGGSLNLWPLAIIAMLVYSLPQFVSGFVGSWLAAKLRPD